MKKFVMAICIIVCSNLYAWSGDGHRYVAQIAYNNLTPKTRAAVDKLTYPEGERFKGRSRFIYISNWADRIRFQGDHRFDQWHYVDLPISVHGAPTKPMNRKNAVYAIEKSKKALASKNTTKKNKLLYLKLLVHCVGDIHQPLHSVNRFTWRTPNGDFGGNTYMIFNPHHHVTSLHAYWDGGLGLFKQYNKRYRVHPVKIQKVAKLLEAQYDYLKKNSDKVRLGPAAWAQEGRYLARHYVYNTEPKAVPNQKYNDKGQEIVKQRIALAGFRLAHILNGIYDTKG